MLAKTFTASLQGLVPTKIEVEVDTIRGQPKLIIIGLPTQAVAEAKERVTSAILNCGVRIRSRRTIVNLAPADLKKSSSCFELPIAVALLKHYREIPATNTKTMFFGEFSLNGDLKPLRGALALVEAAKKLGFQEVVVPAASVSELKVITGIKIFPINRLNDYVDSLKNGKILPELLASKFSLNQQNLYSVAVTDIAGQELAKRALVIAAAGRHHLLMVGPPGIGKSMLAQGIISLLPPLTREEAVETSIIHAAHNGNGLLTQRPFRSPHHTATAQGLLGGGRLLSPGEFSLAHRGVLFLDELPLFSRPALESLREPLESGWITLTRGSGSIRYPARFSLIAAANPCPCGFMGTNAGTCTCTPSMLDRYQAKISGPLRDRIDMTVYLEAASPTTLRNQRNDKLLQEFQEMVLSAQEIQQHRYRKEIISNNSELTSKTARLYCPLSEEAEKLLVSAASRLQLSTRGYFSVLKVARTISDLEKKQVISKTHLAEALQFRIGT